jgi:hypothetical protein
MEVGSRRIVHCSITAHPTAAWTLQQFREAIPSDHSYRFLLHDRDAIFSAKVDQQLKTLELLRTPARAPKANAYCERLVGSMRRECVDFMIPLDEKHLRRILAEWVTHYNQGRPHLSLGPGIPEPAAVCLPWQGHDRHSFAKTARLRLARFSAASITNTGGKGSPREGREELSGHCTLTASPQFLMPVQAGRPVPFVLRRDERVGVRTLWFLFDPSSPARARIL